MSSAMRYGLPSFIWQVLYRLNKKEMRISRRLLWFSGLIGAVLLVSQTACAGPLRERIMERRAGQQAETAVNDVRVLRDVAYGQNAKQRMDVYLPTQAAGAPVIFMVHGGAWRLGDKGAQAVVDNKVARWVSKGFILISTNYRLLPEAAPLEQTLDVARALAAAQGQVATCGGDPGKFILMGHSAGAHLVALLAASPEKAYKLGVQPWLGAVLLDSAALDVVQIMENKHARFYDRAFGEKPAYWQAVSPFHVLEKSAAPFLAVCSSRREDACSQAEEFAAKARTLGVSATVLPQNLSHKEINKQLGVTGPYTDAVEAFMGSLDDSLLPAPLKP